MNNETNNKMTLLQSKLADNLSEGKLIIQKNNRLFIEDEPLNTKTLVSYIIKQFPNDDYRLKLKELVIIK